MEDASDNCSEIPPEGSGAEQPPASSQGKAVGEAENGDAAEKPLLPESSGIVQSEEGCEQMSPWERSVLEEQEQSSLEQWERPEEVSREEQTSQNSALRENTASGTVTESMIEDNETLRRTGPNFEKTVQSENQQHFPGQGIRQDYHMPDVITVRVQTDSDSFQAVVVKIERPTYNKPFLGGFRNIRTGVEFHNAGSQTRCKKRPNKATKSFGRETQTVWEKNKPQQTRNTTSTQMTKIGLYVSNMTDKLISPGKYFTAEEYHKRRLEAVIVLQKYFRRWHAINVVQNLREQKKLRLAWEAQEESRKKKEKEEKFRREYERKLNPRTKEDFELLYHDLELWMQEETERINRTLTGAERKAALCALLEQETQLIACFERHKLNANEENQHKAVLHLLDKCAQPKRWKAYDGKITEMDTQDTLRARELLEIYRSISAKDIPKDERTDVLLTLRCTVKVPQDPLKLYKNVYFCHSCENYLPSTEFVIPANSHTIGRCRSCYKLDNEARRRESYLKYRLILENLRKSEADYQDDSKIVFVVQLPDLQYMIENIWNCQSALSAWGELYDLVMVRWDKQHEWSPWNTILLTKEEADVHLKLCNLQEAYEAAFIFRIKQKHIRAKNYFSQIPAMSSFLPGSDNQATASSYKTHNSSMKFTEVKEVN
ncbi:IQ and ubiquitin-like domain-containing protein isoform X2 [Myiozetetes cayanensis]|uniref:IQ and ubiquitin-like domain-containing protein isoform X2 n=1 Tax=Myiozetetes cayanensis TaxID=478635 RepID=UPI00215DF675|nr:IQ and ubiquitin-like domain-containing protein isoform X2 [Myiozetetes cayanensis]